MNTFYLLPDDEQTPSSRHDRRRLGQKAPFKPREVWAIRALLQIQGLLRELALFNLAIDSKLRGCDLVSLRVRDICIGGRVNERPSSSRRKRTDRFSERRRECLLFPKQDIRDPAAL